MKQPGHADAYVGLKVKYIPGRIPELTIFDNNNEELETIDLSKVHSLTEILNYRFDLLMMEFIFHVVYDWWTSQADGK